MSVRLLSDALMFGLPYAYKCSRSSGADRSRFSFALALLAAITHSSFIFEPLFRLDRDSRQQTVAHTRTSCNSIQALQPLGPVCVDTAEHRTTLVYDQLQSLLWRARLVLVATGCLSSGCKPPKNREFSLRNRAIASPKKTDAVSRGGIVRDQPVRPLKSGLARLVLQAETFADFDRADRNPISTRSRLAIAYHYHH